MPLGIPRIFIRTKPYIPKLMINMVDSKIFVGVLYSYVITDSSVIVLTNNNTRKDLSSVVSIAASRWSLCSTLVLSQDGTLSEMSADLKTPKKIDLPPVKYIAVGVDCFFAIGQDGGLSAWGKNYFGQLGNNTTTESLVPIKIDLPPVVSVVTGENNTFAIGQDGGLSAWGKNTSGQFGNNSTTGSLVPIKIDLPPVIAIAAGRYHTLGLGVDGTLSAWGDNQYYQFGNNTTTDSLVPIKIDLPPVKAIAAGSGGVGTYTDNNNASYAIGVDGGLSAWGTGNGHQSLGIPSGISKTPYKLNIPPVVNVAVSNLHGIAITDDGSLFGWGHASYYGKGGHESSPVKIN